MDTKTEITVIVDGHERSQAIFLDDGFRDLSLHDIRDVLTGHGLELPAQYKFMTKSKNLIAPLAEQSMTLKGLIEAEESETSASGSGESQQQDQPSETNTAPDQESSIPKIYIAPIFKTNEDGKGVGNKEFEDRQCPQPQQQSQTQSHSQDGENQQWQSQRSENRDEQFGDSRCPMHSFNHAVAKLREHVDWKLIIKLLLFFSFLLTCLLLSLTVMIHLLTCMVNPQELLAPWMMPGLKDSEELSGLKLKMSELEISTRYEVQDLRKRLSELEDMYLKDLKLVTENSNALKGRVSQLDTSFQLAVDAVAQRVESLALGLSQGKGAAVPLDAKDMGGKGDQDARVEDSKAQRGQGHGNDKRQKKHKKKGSTKEEL